MVFDEIVGTVMRRLNLTSASAKDRVGENVNLRWKYLASRLGLQTIARVESSPGIVSPGQRHVTFNLQTLACVYEEIDGDPGQPRVLGEGSFDELRNLLVGTGTANVYAKARLGSNSITLILDNKAGETAYTLKADGTGDISTLSGNMVPSFPENYHEILVVGAMVPELYKLEKPSLAEQREAEFESQLSDLRHKLAVSAYQTVYQGKSGGWGRGTRRRSVV